MAGLERIWMMRSHGKRKERFRFRKNSRAHRLRLFRPTAVLKSRLLTQIPSLEGGASFFRKRMRIGGLLREPPFLRTVLNSLSFASLSSFAKANGRAIRESDVFFPFFSAAREQGGPHAWLAERGTHASFCV